jgi:hypothetical protein
MWKDITLLDYCSSLFRCQQKLFLKCSPMTGDFLQLSTLAIQSQEVSMKYVLE